MENIEKLLKPTELEELLCLRRSKIHRMLATGEIPSVIVSRGARRRVFRVRPSDLAKWLRDRQVGK
jgi:predicted DNA-binding transcriptional regulator AlpA